MKPDLLVFSTMVGHTVMCEWKSGRNTEDDQLERYAAVTADDLRSRASIPAAATVAHDTAVFGLRDHVQTLTEGIQRNVSNAVLVVVDDDGLERVLNGFAVPGLNVAFGPRLAVAVASAPLSFVPFDSESPDWVVAEKCLQQVVAYMAQGHPKVFLDQLCADTVPAWGLVSPDAKRSMRERVKRIVTQAAQAEFKTYLSRSKGVEGMTHTPTWDIVENPLDLTTDRRSVRARALRSAAERFTRMLKSRTAQMGLDLDEPERGDAHEAG